MNIKKLSVVLLTTTTLGFISPIGSAISVKAQENAIEQHTQVLSEDDNHRTVQSFSPEFNQNVIYTFHKKTGILDINKNGQIESYNVKAIGEEILNSRSGFLLELQIVAYSALGPTHLLEINTP